MRTGRESRLGVLCRQSPRVLTGIDFVQVVNPATQTRLRVFFLIEPDDVTPVLVTPAELADPTNGATDVHVSIIALGKGSSAVKVTGKNWRLVTLGSLTRICLEIVVAEPGGFEPYRLTLTHVPPGTGPDQVDPFSSSVVFDFKQACETGFDCEHEQRCPHHPGVDFPVDYLARDFGSLRRALLDFATQRHPDWREPVVADSGVMLLEIMAALGDEFAYTQDRYDAETRFGSATQRASLFSHARLVEYLPHVGHPASGEVVVTASADGTMPADAVVHGAGVSLGVVPFSIDAAVWVHPFWNRLEVHSPDPEQDCLAAGQTEILLVADMPPASTPPDPSNPGSGLSPSDFLIGRRMMLLSDPTDASRPRRAWPVTVTSVQGLVDPLILTGGTPTKMLRLGWTPAAATPFDLPLDGLTVALNVASVTAGEPVTEYVRAGEDGDVEDVVGVLPPMVKQQVLRIPRLVEREGPYAGPVGAGRSVVARAGLAGTEATSLRFDAAGEPRITVHEVAAPVAFPIPLPTEPGETLALFGDDVEWQWVPDVLQLDLDSLGFTVEPGLWRTVETHRLPTEDLLFRDYATDAGWTVKFGFGDLGRPPTDGTILRLRYHTDPGLEGNIASFAMALSWPLGAAPDPQLTGFVSAVTNPLPFDNACIEETAGSIRLNAPHHYRARPRRAVLPEDYSAIIELLPWVDRAFSTTRWTGSWSTDFVAVDPVHSVAMTDDQWAELATEIDCIRLAARDARPVGATYLDVDVEVVVCVAAGFFAGDVLKRVRETLAPPGFFGPANFTFGDPLRRSAIEVAVQRVPGVAHVDGINVRVHGMGDWRPFAEPAILAGPDEIIRLQDDPDRSTLGLLRVRAAGVM